MTGLSVFLVHTAACTPDAGLVDVIQRDDTEKTNLYDLEGLLDAAEAPGTLPGCDECGRRTKRTFDAYPDYKPPEVIPRRRPPPQKKPFSAISVHVEQLTSETYEEDDLAGIPELLEVVRLQGTGSQEVARALRKKLKYGNAHRQLRALAILDGLLQNGGSRVQRALLSDGPLLERLRIAAVDPLSDQDVRAKCKDLFGQWVASSKTNPGLEGAKSLYNQLPKTHKPVQQRREQSRVLRETEEDVQREQELDYSRERSNSSARAGEPSSPTTLRKQSTPVALGSSSTFMSKKVKKDKKNKGQVFNLEREKPQILQAIAASSVASTGLNNALKIVNRERERVSSNAEVMKRFETCKQLRRQILRYIQLVETEEFLGGLIHANEELVNALMAFEIMDKSIDDDSDSELEEAQHLSRQQAKSEQAAAREAEKMVANLSVSGPPKPPKPPRPVQAPTQIAMPPPRLAASSPGNTKARQVDPETESESDFDDDDSDDPFGDKNAMKTPDPDALGKKGGYTWREV